jgi:replicative DNA helicase
MVEKVTLGYLGYKFQVELINQLLHPANKKFADRIIDILHARYFDNEYFRLIITTLKDYRERFDKLPTWDTLETIMKVEIKDNITRDYVFEIMKEIREMDVEDWEFIQEKSLNFCRQQELKKANDKISKIVDSGDFDKYEECAEIMKEALSVGMEKDDGTSIKDDFERVLDEHFRDPIPTGIIGIDELTKGGLARGELGVILAPFGTGKTTILSKIANTAFNLGYNVLQIVFEDLPDVIKRKHAACWSGIDLNEFDENKEELIKIVKEKTENKQNDLLIKKFPSEGITMNNIKNYVRHLISIGFKPDMIIIDYIDCVESTKKYSEEWSGEANVMRSFESMLSEHNMVGWSAVQGNRNSISSDVVTGDQMGGSIKKAQIAHLIISIARTLPQKEANRATLAIIKSRFGKDGVIFEDCTFHNGKLLIDTQTSDTFLGYEKKQIEKKEESQRERLKKIKDRKGNDQSVDNN